MNPAVLLLSILLFLASGRVYAFPKTPLLSNIGDTSLIVIPNAKPEGEWRHDYDMLAYSGMVYNPFQHSVIAFGGGHATNTFPVAVPEFDIQSLTWHYIVDEVGCGPLADPANLWYNSSSQRVGGYFYNGKHYAGSQHTYDGLVMAADTNLCINVCTGMYGAAKPYCISESAWSQLTGGGSIFLLDRENGEWQATENTSLSVGHPISASNPLEPDWIYLAAGDQFGFYKVNYKTEQKITLARRPSIAVSGTHGMEYYGPEHCFYTFPGSGVFKYDIASNTWSQMNTTGTQPGCGGRNIAYDTLNKVFGVFTGDNAGGRFHYYGPVEKRWYSINRSYSIGRNLFHHHVYDPVNNVHILASQGSDYFWQTLAFKLSDTPGRFPGTGIGHPSTITHGVRQAGMAMGLTVSPNPFKTAVAISFNNAGRRGGSRPAPTPTLSVYDVHGRMVHSARMTTAGSYVWNVSGLPSGIYLLKAAAAGKTLTKRLFLQK